MRLIRIAIVLALLAGCTSDDPAGDTSGTTSGEDTTSSTAPEAGELDADSPIGADGIGPLKAGMTLAAARQATEREIVLDGFEGFGGYCWFGKVEGLEQDFVLLFLAPERNEPVENPEEGILGRVSSESHVTSSPAGTAAGVELGSTKEEVLEAYEEGHSIETTPHFYVEGGEYIDVTPAEEEDLLLRFETDQAGRVTAIHGGVPDAARLAEGCA